MSALNGTCFLKMNRLHVEPLLANAQGPSRHSCQIDMPTEEQPALEESTLQSWLLLQQNTHAAGRTSATWALRQHPHTLAFTSVSNGFTPESSDLPPGTRQAEAGSHWFVCLQPSLRSNECLFPGRKETVSYPAFRQHTWELKQCFGVQREISTEEF